MKTRYRFFEGIAGKVLAIIALAAMVGFTGCPTTTEEEEGPTLAGSVRIIGDLAIETILEVNTEELTNAKGYLSYVWERADSAGGTFAPIQGKTAVTYTVASGDKDKFIRVTVNSSGNTGEVRSEARGPVGLPRLTGTVNITGATAIGLTLTANTTGLSGQSGTLTYVWERADSAAGDFSAISGATAATYTVASEDKDTYIRVKVSSSGNADSLSSDALGPLGLPRLEGTVGITGTLKVGETLTANTAGLSGQSGDLTYVWERGDGAFSAIPDAGTATYALTDAESGIFIRVRVSSSGNAGDIISETRGPVPVPLTADISFIPTENNTAQVALAVNTVTGAGELRETWTLNAKDQSPVYFTVSKTEDQIITVSGTDAAKVSQAGIGESRDGSEASDTLGVFGVNIGDILFEGTGTKAFTLNITELGKAPKTVSVTLNISPQPLTGVAVFKVLEDPTPKVAGDEILERIQGIKHFDMTTMDFETDQSSTAENLLDALAWIDRNAEAQGDYLVRVEQNEQLPLIRLSCLYQEVKIRLRGLGQEQEITHNNQPAENLGEYGWNMSNTYAHRGWYYLNGIVQNPVNPGTQDAFILVGVYGTLPNSPAPVAITLQLEDNITLKGKDQSEHYREMLYLHGNCALIMLEGSTITGHTSSNLYSPVIRVFGNASSSLGQAGYIYMYGGAIRDNRVIAYDGEKPNGQGLIYYAVGRSISPGTSAAGWRKNGIFVKEGGSITGNTNEHGESFNKVNFVNEIVTIEESLQYFLPPYTPDTQE
jgi:hypothetical protein